MRAIKTAARAALFSLLAVLITVPCLAGGTNWGLSYPNLGQMSVGPHGREALLEHDTYYVGDGAEKTIYLTFDAGYENGCTPPILEVLKKTNVPAAFFLTGSVIRTQPELVRRMVAEGHIVANHTMTHPDMSAITDLAAFQKELADVETQYKALTGQEMPKYYRPPSGIYSIENLKMAKELGYKTVLWSLAYVDWRRDNQPSREEAFSKLLPRAHPGMVILLHSTSKTNAAILEELIGKYKEMGYEFRSLDQLTA